MESISCWILSFKPSRDRGRCLKTFSFRYPQRKTSHGLKSGDRAGHSTCPLKEIKRLGNNNNNNNKAPDVHLSNPLWVLTTVEAIQPHDTTPTSLPPLQPSQCPFEKWEIFMPHPVLSSDTHIHTHTHTHIYFLQYMDARREKEIRKLRHQWMPRADDIFPGAILGTRAIGSSALAHLICWLRHSGHIGQKWRRWPWHLSNNIDCTYMCMHQAARACLEPLQYMQMVQCDVSNAD